jgi:hypothetical protein
MQLYPVASCVPHRFFGILEDNRHQYPGMHANDGGIFKRIFEHQDVMV